MIQVNVAEAGAEKKKSQLTLYIMMGTAVLPVVAAWFVFFTGIGLPNNTVNYGHFIQPAASIEPLVSKALWQTIENDKKWRLLHFLHNGCDDKCQKNLYVSRQVHIRLAQKSERIERIALIDKTKFTEQALENIQQSHPRMTQASVNFAVLAPWLANLSLADAQGDFYVLVDQEGRAMMAYGAEHEGGKILKDIKRALKFSIDYQS